MHGCFGPKGLFLVINNVMSRLNEVRVKVRELFAKTDLLETLQHWDIRWD